MCRIQYAFLITYHSTVVIENCHRSLPISFSRRNFITSLTPTSKMHPRLAGKKTTSQSQALCCCILQVRLWTSTGRKTRSENIMCSKNLMCTGSLTSWGRTSVRFSVQGQNMHCGCCYFSIICSGGYIYRSRANWSHKLIVFVKSEEKKYRYTPQNDFHVSVDQLTSLLVEVQSDKNERDRYRMLLKAACAARLGRHLYNDLFIVVALYIQNSGTVTRYFVFQRNSADRRVCTFESKQSCIFSLL